MWFWSSIAVKVTKPIGQIFLPWDVSYIISNHRRIPVYRFYSILWWRPLTQFAERIGHVTMLSWYQGDGRWISSDLGSDELSRMLTLNDTLKFTFIYLHPLKSRIRLGLFPLGLNQILLLSHILPFSYLLYSYKKRFRVSVRNVQLKKLSYFSNLALASKTVKICLPNSH